MARDGVLQSKYDFKDGIIEVFIDISCRVDGSGVHVNGQYGYCQESCLSALDMDRLARGEDGSKTEMYKKIVKALYVKDPNSNGSTRLTRLKGHPLPYLPLYPVDEDEDMELEDLDLLDQKQTIFNVVILYIAKDTDENIVKLNLFSFVNYEI